ncbi:SusD/RagB family nutrient-binding outer membrane lipoprotein [Flagellimonas sp. 389]|uniref:SusD/RagB family nutrient-binding outer membrane lipoprotein n=1 Tax=Flagellimonas sp. 389 TaxID=2835862 RepID=UPI001BD3869E|nr:SusD/RagB family nutrient-binding outer membrane lipoprotein [Flagellimonas sp. 389]MBS9461733.1 SusD/RagB family nutrient-binding outer membrane lipoprotein [Flagellimonas sp. 389]
MKNIYKYLGLVLFSGVLLMTSCETIELDLTENPNQLRPDQSSPDLFLNSIQVDFATFTELMGQNGADLIRIGYMNGRNYQNVTNYNPNQLNTEWQIAFQADANSSLDSGLEFNGILADIRAMTPAAIEGDLFYHIGIGEVIEAYTIVTLVDFFGDVPYSEALQGNAETPILNPNVDPGSSIYDAALALLDDAIVNFGLDAPNEPANDFYYNGDWDNWIKAANTLKMKIHLQRRLVDPTAIASFDAIVASGDYIDAADGSEDFEFQWGTNPVQPDARHPRYADNYTPSGGADYLPNWLLDYMNQSDDPRIRYYFYRQNSATPGAEAPPNEETLACSLEPVPAHYIDGGFPFCFLPNGYWGRDHGQNAGIPPDGFLRTVYGVYPSGGKFDDSSFNGLSVGSGGGGAGVTPILLASWVDFWKAEDAMLSNIDAGKAFMLDGIQKSMTKVRAFGSLDSGADNSFAASDADVTNFVNQIDSEFDSKTDDDDKWDLVAEQYFVALFGNGIDGYNYYRRTGYPTTLQPNFEPDPGAFIRSLNYPADFVNNNSSQDPKPNQTVKVFWDTNGDFPEFPPAN